MSCCEPVVELFSIVTVKPLEQESASKVPSSTPQLPVCTDTTILFSSPAYNSESWEALFKATAGFTLVTVKVELEVMGMAHKRSRCFVVTDNWVSWYLPSPPAVQESLNIGNNEFSVASIQYLYVFVPGWKSSSSLMGPPE